MRCECERRGADHREFRRIRPGEALRGLFVVPKTIGDAGACHVVPARGGGGAIILAQVLVKVTSV